MSATQGCLRMTVHISKCGTHAHTHTHTCTHTHTHTEAHAHTYEHTHAQKFMQFYPWIYCTIDLKDFTTQKWYNVDTCTYDKYLYQIPDNAWPVSQLRVKCTGMKILKIYVVFHVDVLLQNNCSILFNNAELSCSALHFDTHMLVNYSKMLT